MKRYYEVVDTIFDYIPCGHEKVRGIRIIWPLVLATQLLGGSIELAILVIREVRRSIYNRNRNLKYAKSQSKSHRRTAKAKGWMGTRGRGKKVVLPLPPRFTEELQRQWDRVHDSLEEMLKFGEMLIELDDYVDNSFIFDGNDNIVGRMPGMKGFLAEHCPHIGYKTAMRFRSLALKARKVATIQRVKPSDVCADCRNANELAEKLDASLSIDHRRMAFKRRRPRRMPDNSIFALRERTHSTLSQLDTVQRQRYLHALRELIREHSVS